MSDLVLSVVEAVTTNRFLIPLSSVISIRQDAGTTKIDLVGGHNVAITRTWEQARETLGPRVLEL